MHIPTPALLIPLLLATLAATTPVPAHDPTPPLQSLSLLPQPPTSSHAPPQEAKKIGVPPPPPPPRQTAAPRPQWAGAPLPRPSFQVRPVVGLPGGQWVAPNLLRGVGGPRVAPNPPRGGGGGGGGGGPRPSPLPGRATLAPPTPRPKAPPTPRPKPARKN